MVSSTSPFSLLLLLLLMALMISWCLATALPSVWYSLFLFFIMVGGVLIMISYCSSFLPSEPMSIYPLSLIMLLFSLSYLVAPFTSTQIFMSTSSHHISTLSITILYSTSWLVFMIMLFIWLLFLLTGALHMLNLGSGHLREVSN